ncbi:MAG: YbhB/YbcL family Raf kinase inhibitor-like protein [Candidatus Latescibacterota bacterium]|nr:MAG: YbhB/YbcL family Raf kinase inhibitor-like protein [Candidatus Latescibacterota bacterium]
MSILITSTAFDAGTRIPRDYTGEGRDVSPPLAWENIPDGTQELALICDDPDAPVAEPWVHWVLYKLPPTLTHLSEGDHGGGTEGFNDFRRIGYGGPMPPPGHGTHRYYFKLYALDAPIALDPGATKKELLAAMQGHILAQGELIGTYER